MMSLLLVLAFAQALALVPPLHHYKYTPLVLRVRGKH